MKNAFQVHLADNVATLLADAAVETIAILGEKPVPLDLREAIKLGHKVALSPIPTRAAVIKFGVSIGHATRDIAPGEWVHLHNCASNYDERSNTLDRQTGAPTDTTHAYT